MTETATRRAPARMILESIAEPLIQRVLAHPFWVAVRAGDVPEGSLLYFAGQDGHHLVPAYARGLARCAAVADRTPTAALLLEAAAATIGSVPRLESELGKLAVQFGKPHRAGRALPGPAVSAYASFVVAAPVESLAAGLGALLPMSVFHLAVSRDLQARGDLSTPYAWWLDQFIAHDGFEGYLDQFWAVVEEEAGLASGQDWRRLVECFSTAADCELAFADAAWRKRGWPGC